ncbi:MAG: hypothetical protein RLZZ397_1361 [Pseudomonadota bacterium]
MLKKTLWVAVVGLPLTTLPLMASADSGPHWNMLQLDYRQHQPDAVGQDLNGYGLSGSFLVNDSVFVKGGLTDQSKTIAGVKNTLKTTDIQVGYIVPANEQTDFYAALGYRWSDPTYNGVNTENNDATLALGVRGMVTPEWELRAGLGTFDGDAEYLLGATYKFTPEWGMAVEYRESDIDKGWLIGVRLDF